MTLLKNLFIRILNKNVQVLKRTLEDCEWHEGNRTIKKCYPGAVTPILNYLFIYFLDTKINRNFREKKLVIIAKNATNILGTILI